MAVVVSFLYLVEIFFSDSGAAFANLSLVKMNPKYCFLTKGLCFQTIHRTHLIKEGFVNSAPDSDSVKVQDFIDSPPPLPLVVLYCPQSPLVMLANI